jgi:hypothetical protein
MSKRKSRTSLATKQSHDFLTPIDITKFGTEEDPCFGKHNEPKAPECQRCGDFEFCMIVTSENLKRVRKKEEKKTEYKDLNPTPKIQEIREYMGKELCKSSKIKVVIKATKKFGISKEKAKTIINNL